MNPNRIGAVLLAVGLLFTLTTVALADHPVSSDGGFDLAWSEPMNHPSFWESYFGDGYTCSKFENHSGQIPSSYEAAVVKSGSEFVRVYTDPPANVLGPPNPNVQHPNRRHTAPFSWVMKCDYEQTTTTVSEETTTSDTTTTTETEESSTTTTTTPTTSTPSTTTPPGSTPTTEPASSTSPSTPTTQPAPTTSVPTDGSTTAPSTSPSTSTGGGNGSESPSSPSELPFTGIGSTLGLVALGASFIGGGFRLVRGRWGR